ncbi:retrovirus-related pol polyprotein line-1 [Plakobranchus ocellatus]|uniref:Retrovirus-related pol polyprotein line-1 n=1 Tax=Plakobranchus ocellatus TaxID=259542 RepID=A0AAV4AAF9_9GAST|nr:retrovirus-related pol polyprotein line-1 [Plakobranchus ocellatus]
MLVIEEEAVVVVEEEEEEEHEMYVIPRKNMQVYQEGVISLTRADRSDPVTPYTARLNARPSEYYSFFNNSAINASFLLICAEYQQDAVTLEVQKDAYLCFIDYTNAFDRKRHDEIITQLKQLNIDGKDLRIIKTMYWEQTAAMRIENKTSTFQDIKRGVRQGCVLSPDLFLLYSEIIMRNLENHPGIKVGGQNINNLRYADDTVLLAENKEDLQKLLNIVEEESRKKGLELNSKKTEVMVISRKQESPKCDIFINEVKLKQTEKFKYLGTKFQTMAKQTEKYQQEQRWQNKQRNISKNCSGKDQLSKDENNPDK